ncbi:hypothetical protein LTR93_004722 [Exophiala xenobiotica]|nr:hypothetical protein LTR93_004722 [Exophiala xenobiotica]KAK5411264.1 hypothetical protein LTR06_006156 [Exophiala xenobiotica]KAK5442418.1 hypothetical protein LTR18_006273 [Exophiala xenobiotica]
MGASADTWLQTTKLKPCFAEILRTCVKPTTLVVRVEHVLDRAHPRSHRNTAVEDQVLKNDLKEQDAHASHSSEETAHRDIVPDCLRLAVSDGQLQIQAVLARHLHRKELLELQKGDLVEVRDFQVRSAPRLSGQGRVVFLAVDACEWIGRDAVNEIEPDFEGGFLREEIEEDTEQDIEGGFLREGTEDDTIDMDPAPRNPLTRGESALGFTEASIDMHAPGKRHYDSSSGGNSPRKKRHLQQPAMAKRKSAQDGRRSQIYEDDSDSDCTDEDSFDTVFVSQSQVEKRREVLKHISQNTRQPRIPAFSKPDCYSEVESDGGSTLGPPPSLTWPADESNVGRDHTNVDEMDVPSSVRPSLNVDGKPTTGTASQFASVRAPVHTLSSLLDASSTLPRRSYTCTILAVVSWVSPSIIHKPNTPFPPKRHIKIHDQTISHRQAGVTVAVFVDAKNFLPKVGTVALLRGVVMHRFADDVILNKYATPASADLKGSGSGSVGDLAQLLFPEQDWFITDPETLVEMGFDVSSLASREPRPRSWIDYLASSISTFRPSSA